MKSIVLFLVCFFASAPLADARPMFARRAAGVVVGAVQRVNEARPHLPRRAAQAFINRERRPIQTVVVRSFSRIRGCRSCN